jgi:RecA/RadA recombinase
MVLFVRLCPEAKVASVARLDAVVAAMKAEAPAVVDEDEGEQQPDEVIDRVVARLEPHFVRPHKHAIAYAFGGWARQRGWNSADAARVVERLPSDNPRSRVKDARDGYKANQGWHALREALGEQAAVELDAITPNPRREREVGELDVLRAMMPAQAPAPAPIAPAASSGLLDRLRRVQNAGPPVPSGLGPIDKALRGGFRAEKILVVGGAPGAGKTSLVRQLADSVARQGAAVGWLAADEEPAGIDARRLQALGVPRHLAEKPDDATIGLAERELAPLPFEIFDSADGWTVDHVFVEMGRRFPDRPRLIVLDSLQTVQTPRSSKLEVRARIDDVIATVKTLSRTPATAASVIIVSELARGAYRSEASAESTADIAAFKESGGIEYGGHTLLVLRSVKDSPDFVEAAMPKNRVGPKVPFTLKMDPETTAFAESFENPRDERDKIAIELAIPDVKKALEGCGWPGLTQTALEKLVPRDSKVTRKALQLMKERGIASMNYGPRNAVLWTLGTLPQPGAGGPMPPPVEPSLAASQDEFAKAIGGGE